MIIGLTGKKGAGKNAVAKALAAHSPLPVREVSFAAKLKESAAAVLGCEVEDLERWKNDPYAQVWVGIAVDLEEPHMVGGSHQSIRSFLQRTGTEGHRNVFGEDFWLDAALPYDWMAGGEKYDDALYVVTDVRFENEAQRVLDLGGTVVRVIGPPEVEFADDDHASEEPLSGDLVGPYLSNVRRDDDFAALNLAARKLLSLLTERQTWRIVGPRASA